MKPVHWKYLAVVLLLLSTILALSWYRVDGSELQSMDNLSEAYTVSVIKWPKSQNNHQSIEYTLNAEQIMAFKELVLDSSFTRQFSHSYSYNGMRDTYSILLELYNEQDKQVDFIQIFFVEDLYFSISSPYAEE